MLRLTGTKRVMRIGVMAAQQTLTLLVEGYVRDVEVAGSNPVTPIPPFRWGIFLSHIYFISDIVILT